MWKPDMLKDTWILFDLDGTLTRSEEGIWNCARYAAAKIGLPEPDQATLIFITHSASEKAVQQAVKSLNPDICRVENVIRVEG